MYITVRLSDGTEYEGIDAISVVTQMRLRDWDIPESNLDFKDNMVRRIQMTGYTIVYWDATSFLMALAELGFLTLYIGGAEVVKKE